MQLSAPQGTAEVTRPDNNLDDIDRRILNIIQSHFPIEARPYRAIGQQVGLTEAEVMDRITALKEAEVIRRLGGNVSSRSVGYVSTLCAASVPDDKFDLFVAQVNARPGVTHNYLRRHELNIWFTFIAPSQEELEAELAAIEDATGVAILNLPADRMFKIQVDFPV